MSGVSCHVTFPARIAHEQAGICRSLRLIARMSGVSGRDRPGAGFQLPFQIGANGLQSFGRGCFEAKDQRGLRVGGTNESPAIIETDSNSVNRDHFTNHEARVLRVRRIRLFCRLDKPVSYRLDQPEFHVVRTLHANFRGDLSRRQIRQEGKRTALALSTGFQSTGTRHRWRRRTRNSDRQKTYAPIFLRPARLVLPSSWLSSRNGPSST